MAEVEGPYKTYKGSPISKGEFQHNMWGIKDDELSGRWDWVGLRKADQKARCSQFPIDGTDANSVYLSNFRKQRMF